MIDHFIKNIYLYINQQKEELTVVFKGHIFTSIFYHRLKLKTGESLVRHFEK